MAISTGGSITIIGTLAAGNYTISGTVSDASGDSGVFTFTLVVQPTPTPGTAPVFTSPFIPVFTQGVGGTAVLSATGAPAPSIAETAPLPTGVSFDTSLDVLSVGAGTPVGTYTLTFVASNSVASDSQIFVLRVVSNGEPTSVLGVAGVTPGTVSLTWFAPDLSATPGVSVTGYTIVPTNLTLNTSGAPVAVSPSTTSNDFSGLVGGDTYDFVVTATLSTFVTGSATSNLTLPVAAAPMLSTVTTGNPSYSQSTTSNATIGTMGTEGSISAIATGQGSVSVAVYSGNPAGAAFTTAPGATDVGYDVSVSPGAQFQTISFEVCGDPSGQVYWFDSLTQQTIAVLPGPVPVAGPNNCVMVNLSTTSTPAVGSDLYGTIFFVQQAVVSPPGGGGGTTSPGVITFLTQPPALPVVGGSYTVAATSPSGIVTFTTTSSACSLSGDTVTFVAAGTCTVTANVPANTNYAATSAAWSFSIAASVVVTPTSVTPVAAPTSVTAVAGDARATVSWSPSSNAASFTSVAYTVTASPGGATCTTSSATRCVVRGLTNGTAYTFTVVASSSGPASTSPPSTLSSNAIPNSVKATLRVTLPHFATNSSTLTASMKVRLVELAASMVRRTVSSMTLTGHTDNVGSRAAGRALGLRRAKAVAAFLHRQLKIDHYTRAIVWNVKTLGRARPLKPNTTAAGRSANNRVIVVAITK